VNVLIPADFDVPQRLETPDFVIRPLRMGDVHLDYIAVMTSLDIIKSTRGGDWPTTDLTFEQDLIDLAWHENEFQNRTSFAYTVMNPAETECLGCLYLYPPGHRGDSTQHADVDASFWVTQKAFDHGLYQTLFVVLDGWLRGWPFRSVAYSNAELPTK